MRCDVKSVVRTTTDLLASDLNEILKFPRCLKGEYHITRSHNKIVCKISERFVVLSHQRSANISKDGPRDTILYATKKNKKAAAICDTQAKGHFQKGNS